MGSFYLQAKATIAGLAAILIITSSSFVSAQSNSSRTIDDLWNKVTALENALIRHNAPPTANAGADLSILTSESAALKGATTDDGILTPLAITWSQVSGPGATSFASQAAVTTATFTQQGTYVLRMSVNDGVSTVTDDVSIVVNPVNRRPTVDAGADVSMTGTTYVFQDFAGDTYDVICTTTLRGSASDDNLPRALQTSWKKTSHTFSGGLSFLYPSIFVKTTFATPASPTTAVTITAEEGQRTRWESLDVIFELTGNDGQYTVTDTVKVTCKPNYAGAIKR